MRKFKLYVTRKVTEERTVEVEAKSVDEACERYFYDLDEIDRLDGNEWVAVDSWPEEILEVKDISPEEEL